MAAWILTSGKLLILFSSPDPKGLGEFIVWQAVRRPSTICEHESAFIFHRIFVKLIYVIDIHEILDKFDIDRNRTIYVLFLAL